MCVFSKRLSNAKEAWDRIGVPATVKSWITSGVSLPFADNIAPSDIYVNPYKLSVKERAFVQNELISLEISGAIRRVSARPRCVSQIKCVPKKNGKYRIVTDLRLVNEHIEAPYFHNEGINTAAKLVQTGDYMVKTDLKDGFFHIPVWEPHQTFLGFEFHNQYYVWCVLPFGLSCSPYFFNKCLRPLVTFLRGQGIKVVLYVDDCLIVAPKSCITDHRDFVLDTFQELGFVINFEKSQLEPVTKLEFLGYIIDSNGPGGKPWVYISGAKLHKLKKDIKRALVRRKIQARQLAKIAGQAISMSKAVLPGKLKLRAIYAVLQTRNSWSDLIVLDQSALEDLKWWLQAVDSWNGSPLAPRTVDCQIWTDASNTGWGAVCEGVQSCGTWGQDVVLRHINEKELLAVLMALRSHAHQVSDKCVQIMTDNTTTSAYINNLGGPRSQLTELAETIWSTAISTNTYLVARHVAGVSNVQADFLSRQATMYEWMLNPTIFQYINSMWGPHSIDRFASVSTTQLRLYNSRLRDPETHGVDALAQKDWGRHNNFVNAPFCLIGPVLRVIKEQRAVATIIAPFWPGQYWFRDLRKCLIAPPFRIPNTSDMIIRMGETAEPRKNPKWQLFAWRIYGGVDFLARDGQIGP